MKRFAAPLAIALLVALTGCQPAPGPSIQITSWKWNARDPDADQPRSTASVIARQGQSVTIDAVTGPVTFTVAKVGGGDVDMTSSAPLLPADGGTQPVERFTVAATPVRLITLTLDANTHFELVKR